MPTPDYVLSENGALCDHCHAPATVCNLNAEGEEPVFLCAECRADTCEGCGMPDPCGIHYIDCPYLEEGDFTVPRGFTGSRENAATPWTPPEVS